jgi:hypothetical protein
MVGTIRRTRRDLPIIPTLESTASETPSRTSPGHPTNLTDTQPGPLWLRTLDLSGIPLWLRIWFFVMCVGVVIALPAGNLFEKSGWDVHIYLQGVDSVRAGHDPYADAIAVQRAYHEHRELFPANAGTPFSYVYSPITLPAVRFVATHPLWVSAILYWSLYVLGLFAQVFGGFQLVSSTERKVFLFFVPVAGFFPGLLASDILWSGNVALILYGLVLFCAWIGWRRSNWIWFYLAVVLASCVKAPLLSLVVIAPLTASRQWLRASIAAIGGLALFAIQPLIWPSLFKNYLQAVELQFSYNRDFGSSPAGLFSGILYDHHIPYSPASYFFFLAYAVPVFGLLVWLSRQYLHGRFSLSLWGPVVLLGTLLLNPRILEYDEIILTLPLALILWRFFATIAPTRTAITLSIATFFAANAIAYQNWQIWKLTEGPLLVTFFCIGVWTLLHLKQNTQPL